MKRESRSQMEEAVLFGPDEETEETFWVSGRTPLESVLSQEGLSIQSIYPFKKFNKFYEIFES